MQVAITGGLGYLGGRIATHLKNVGYAVRLLTRNSDKALPSWTKGMEVVTADTHKVSSLEQALSKTNMVIHFTTTFIQFFHNFY